MSKVECVAPTGCLLGTGPLWSASEGFLWWVDTRRAKLHRYNPKTGNTRRYDLPVHASALALYQGRLLMLGDREAGLYDPETEDYERLIALPDEPLTNRTSDAGLAPDGSLWFGTRDSEGTNATGRFYRLTPPAQLEPLRFDPVAITNTFQFSPDGRTFYTCDSAAQEIFAFDHDPASGVLSDRRVFADTIASGSYPGGSAIDAEGYLWTAQWAGSRLTRYAPNGAIARSVDLPVSRPTSLAFGGADLCTLYITSARAGLSNAALDKQPLAGCLFALEVDTPGLRVPEWGQARQG